MWPMGILSLTITQELLECLQNEALNANSINKLELSDFVNNFVKL